jgi:hypothetical protein
MRLFSVSEFYEVWWAKTERWMMLNSFFQGRSRLLSLRFLVTILVTMFCSAILLGQSTPGAGGIRGQVVDPQGEPVGGVKITIVNKVRASVVQINASSEGIYSSGPLEPGTYTVRIAGKGFKTAELVVAVRDAEVASGSVKLEAGPESTIQAVSTDEQAGISRGIGSTFCHFAIAIIWILPNSRRDSSIRMQASSIPPRPDYLQSLLKVSMVATHASKSMA